MKNPRRPGRLASLLLLVLLSAGCDRKGGAKDTIEQPAPSASVLSIGVEMGGCADFVACVRECDGGSGDRCRRLGVSYEFGKGVVEDPVHATLLYEKACTMKDSEGCTAAGRMYEFHHGVEKNDAKAASFYERSCALSNSTGCANFAILLENGHGVAKDEARALALFDEACARGAGLACEHARAIRARRAD